jgi:signal transduction histidine kinase/ActR/RegA family two-component response regulator
MPVTISLSSSIGIVIPILGLCCLLPLAAAAYLEPKKDYSRRLYICMLLACAGILVLEGLQLLFDGWAGAGKQAAFRADLLAFYVLLSCLCYCWTVYSYYWFNGHPPRGRAALGFAAGPVCEVGMLVVNLFSGSIYSVSASGSYAREGAFALYIGFCYLYLIISILVTALVAAARNGGGQRRDIQMFLLFFLFPVVGPLAQYLFPDLSLMGTSQALALLTVYVSVQQRTTAQYAVERAHSQDESRAYEQSLERLLAVSPDALCVFHLNLTRNTHSGERGTSRYFTDLCHGDTVDALFEAVAAAIREPEEAAAFRALFARERLLREFGQQRPQAAMAYHRRVDSGETHLVKAYLSMLQNPGSGDVEGIIYSVDIDRQEKEEKVISAITNREYDYIALIDTETRKIHYQYTAQKAGASVYLKMGDYDAVMKEAVASLRAPEELTAHYESISYRRVLEALEQQEEYSYLFPYAAQSGAILQKKITYRYLDERRAEILFFRSDVTEEIRQEREHAATLQAALREAQHASAMKTEFLSNVSHDMRTPLNAVLGYTDLAQGTRDPDVVAAYLEKISRAGNILLSLINDTLDLSKIETGAVTLKPAPVRCGEVISRALAAVRPALDEKHIRLALDTTGVTDTIVSADTLRLQEILINLLSNAVKFTPEGGEVQLCAACAPAGENAVRERVTVRDTGCGMSPEFLSRLYEPFAQEGRCPGCGGSGLGLSIVKKLVDTMGGTIEVKSEQGEGTEFTVTLELPRAQARPETEEPAACAWEDLRGRHILLAEDNAMNTEIARAVLEARGVQVTSVQDGQAACSAFAASAPGTFDAILMDIRMPVMNGRDATRQIRGMERPDALSIPILAMSADAFDDDIQASLACGMNDHIAKPIHPGTLYEKLSRALR